MAARGCQCIVSAQLPVTKWTAKGYILISELCSVQQCMERQILALVQLYYNI